MSRIKAQGPVVDLNGDEMARIIWQFIKDRLISPYLDLDLRYYDLSIQNRDVTDDRATIGATSAIKEHGIGIKCTIITPDEARVEKFGLKKMWKSPNGTIRNILGDVVFRELIIVDNVPHLVPRWAELIVAGRHAFGGQHRATNSKVPDAGTVTLVFTPDDGSQPIKHEAIRMPEGGGIAMGMYSFNGSIADPTRAPFEYGLKRDHPIYLSTKDTILKAYDGVFEDIFTEVFKREHEERPDATGLSYEHRLINDMVAPSLKWSGDYVWTCKNYDEGVQPDIVIQGFNSLELMTSVLVTPGRRTVEAETTHGTVIRHYRQHQEGKKTSANPIASISVWTRGPAHRDMFDSAPELIDLAKTFEEVVIFMVEGERMTKDLTMLISDQTPRLITEEFLSTLDENLTARLSR